MRTHGNCVLDVARRKLRPKPSTRTNAVTRPAGLDRTIIRATQREEIAAK
jgi:hypothetical protein